MEQSIKEICQACNNDRTRMMDVVRAVQGKLGYVPSWAMDVIASQLGTARVEVQAVVSFYAFLSEQPKGKVVIRLADDVVSRMAGSRQVGQALADELGIQFGQTTPDGKISLEYTACIGMNDQVPAALVNDVVVTNLTTDTARKMVRELREHLEPARLAKHLGDGNNANDLVRAMVVNNIRKTGPVVLADLPAGQALRKAIAMTPAEVVRDVKTARLRGRGGAGFPTGMKWDFARAANGEKRYVICNADEGEPGTFKDRVILTEKPDLLFEGMTIAGYAIGADSGIVYLRAEYAYLKNFMDSVLAARRKAGLLGKDVAGKKGFNFDIRIQLGAGAYICGEETALISSCEGLRGDPKTRPPFPAEKGYLGWPTVVNNVETLCCVPQILDKGPGWFAQFGSQTCTGTKLLSVSGDCSRCGVYELPFGITLKELLDLAGADNPIAVQVGGPSGQMVGPADFGRKIDFDDLATGGSVIVMGQGRNVLDVVRAFMDFFIEESCGYCTPCRAGNVLLKQGVEKIMDGHGEKSDIDYLTKLGATIRTTSRCGLGQTSPQPVLTTIKNFLPVYQAMLKDNPSGFVPTFDLSAAVAEAEAIAGHKAVSHQD